VLRLVNSRPWDAGYGLGALNGLVGVLTEDGDILNSVLLRGSVTVDKEKSLIRIVYNDGSWGTTGDIGVMGAETGFAYANPNYSELVKFAQRYNALPPEGGRDVVNPFSVYRLTYVQLIGSIFEEFFPDLVWGWADYKALVDNDLDNANFQPDPSAEFVADIDSVGWWNMPKSKGAISTAATERLAARISRGPLRVPLCLPGRNTAARAYGAGLIRGVILPAGTGKSTYAKRYGEPFVDIDTLLDAPEYKDERESLKQTALETNDWSALTKSNTDILQKAFADGLVHAGNVFLLHGATMFNGVEVDVLGSGKLTEAEMERVARSRGGLGGDLTRKNWQDSPFPAMSRSQIDHMVSKIYAATSVPQTLDSDPIKALLANDLYDKNYLCVPFASVGDGTRVSFSHDSDPWDLVETFLSAVGCCPPSRLSPSGGRVYGSDGYPQCVGDHLLFLLSMPLCVVQSFMDKVQSELFDNIGSYPIQASSWPGFMKKALGYVKPRFKGRKASDSIEWMSAHKASIYSKNWYKCALDQLLSRAVALRPQYVSTFIGFCNRPHLFATAGAVPGADKDLVRTQLRTGDGTFEELRSKIALGYSYYEHEMFAVIYCEVFFGYPYSESNFVRYRKDMSDLFGCRADSVAPRTYLSDLDGGEGLAARARRAETAGTRGIGDTNQIQDTRVVGGATRVNLAILKTVVEPNILKYVQENPMWIISDKVNEKGVKRRTIVNPRLAMFMVLRWGYKIYLSYFGQKHYWTNADFGPQDVEEFMTRLNDEIISDSTSEERWSESPMGKRCGLRPGDRVRACDTGRIGLVGRVMKTAEGEASVVVLYPREGHCESSPRGLIEPLDVSGNDEFVVREFLDAFNDFMVHLLRFDVVGSSLYRIMTGNDKWSEKAKPEKESHLHYWKSRSAEELLRLHVYIMVEMVGGKSETTVVGEKNSGVASGDPFTSELTGLLTAILQRCCPVEPVLNNRVVGSASSGRLGKEGLRAALGLVIRDGIQSVTGDWFDKDGLSQPVPSEICLTLEDSVRQKGGFTLPRRILDAAPHIARLLPRSGWVDVSGWPHYVGPYLNGLEPLIKCEFDGALLDGDPIGVHGAQSAVMPRVPPSGIGLYFGPGPSKTVRVYFKRTADVRDMLTGHYYANLSAGDDAVLASTAERAGALITIALRMWSIRRTAERLRDAIRSYREGGYLTLRDGCQLQKMTRKLQYQFSGATVHPHKNYCSVGTLQFLSTNIVGGVVDELAKDLIVFGDESLAPLVTREYHRKRLALGIGAGGIAAGDPSGIATSLIWGYDVSDPSLFRPDSKWFAIASKFTRYYDNSILNPNLDVLATDLVAALKQYEVKVEWHGNWSDVPRLQRSSVIDKEMALLWFSTPRGPKYHGYGHFPWRWYGARFKWTVEEDDHAPYVHTAVVVEPMKRYVKEGMKLDIIRDDWKHVSYKRGKPAYDDRHLEHHSDYYEWAASLHDDNYQPNKSEAYSVVPLLKMPGISDRVMADWYKRQQLNWYPNMHGDWRRQSNAALTASLEGALELVRYMKERRIFHHAM